ncbi:MAG: hypothetical protein HY899_01470 [Deltaproteobacteria bacterium]|nr:hypothetical protein [Deltaproteobacteria bacterium]
MNGDIQPTLLERTHVGLWILFLCSVYLPLGDLLAGNTGSKMLWWTHGLRLLWFGCLLGALRLPVVKRNAGVVALAASGSIVVTAAFAASARGDSLPVLLVATAVPLVSASLFPWGALMQTGMVAVCAAVPLAVPWLVSGNVFGGLPTNSYFNMASMWALSIYLAHQYARARRSIDNANHSLLEMNSELERRVASRTERLERVNKDLAAFAYSVSHDLRTPLRTIDGFSQLVIESAGGRLEATEREHLDTVRNAAQRMGLLIDAVLRLSRLGQHEVQRQRVDLSAIARAVAADLGSAEPDRKVVFCIEDTPPLNADPVLLRNVVQNLLDNAWKYTAKTDGARIEFGAESGDGEVIYYVRDNGAGFEMAAAGKLFDAFQRLHDPHEFEGTGIGLATVRRILQLHGGQVWAEATVGGGAVFRFTVPER